MFEAAVAFLEAVVPPIAAVQLKAGNEGHSPPVIGALKQLLQQLLVAHVTDAARVLAHARAIEAFAPLTAIEPHLAQAIIDKVGDSTLALQNSIASPGLWHPSSAALEVERCQVRHI